MRRAPNTVRRARAIGAGAGCTAIGAGAGCTAAVVVTAAASRASLSHPQAINGASARAPVVGLALLAVGAGVLALAGLGALLWPGRRRKRPDEPELVLEGVRVHWIWKLAALLFAVGLGAAMVAGAVLGARTAAGPPPQGRGAVRGSLIGPRAAPPASRPPFVLPSWLPWTVLGIVALAAVAGILLAIARWRADARPGGRRQAARAAVEAAIGALDAIGDSRAAVIAAYVAMERVLAERGVARARAEAPREYLRRVLAQAGVAESEARTLTALFEEARFSTHPISARVRQRALASLESLRAGLRAGQAR